MKQCEWYQNMLVSLSSEIRLHLILSGETGRITCHNFVYIIAYSHTFFLDQFDLVAQNIIWFVVFYFVLLSPKNLFSHTKSNRMAYILFSLFRYAPAQNCVNVIDWIHACISNGYTNTSKIPKKEKKFISHINKQNNEEFVLL